MSTTQSRLQGISQISPLATKMIGCPPAWPATVPKDYWKRIDTEQSDLMHASCIHTRYLSVGKFVDHLLSTLQPSPIAKDKHLVMLTELLQCHRLCSVCRNTILSRISLDCLFADFGPQFGSEKGRGLRDALCVTFLQSCCAIREWQSSP